MRKCSKTFSYYEKFSQTNLQKKDSALSLNRDIKKSNNILTNFLPINQQFEAFLRLIDSL